MHKNILYLQNNDIWLEMMQYNTANGNIKVIKRNDKLKINGHYSEINDKIVMLYRRDKCLYLNVNDNEILLDDKDIKLSFERIEKNNKFIVYKGTDVLYTAIYPSCIYDPINIADINFNEDREEDQDFLLFVYNLIQDKSWYNRIYI